ncbi:MAG: ATP-binding protein [Microcystaceae cyanobacterium]
MNVAGLSLTISTILILVYLLQRQTNQRRRTEILLQQQTQAEKLIHQIAHHIRQSLNLENVLSTTVADVREFLDADRVLIYQIFSDGTGKAIKETVLPQYPVILGETFPEEVFPLEYHQAYAEGKVRSITNIEQVDVEKCLAEFVQQFEVKAKLVVPIIQEDKSQSKYLTSSKTVLWGLLIVHQCSQPREWQPLEIDLMKQLATQIAIAIQQSELHTQLQQLNSSLENRVQQRTEELAQINQSLRYSEERFRSLTENALDLIIIINLDGTIYYQNPSCEKILEYTNNELLNKNLFDFIHKDDLAKTTTQLMKSLKIPQSFPPIEFRCQQKKGTYCVLEAVSQQFIDQTQDPKIVINARDITEKKEVEKVKLALERQKELNTLKTRFFSMVSHEFRTPLSTALASVQLLDKTPNAWQNTDKRNRNLSRIQASIKTMVQLLDDISLISRAESSKLDINLETINLAQFLQQIIVETELTIGKQHNLTLTCKEKEIKGQFDPKLLRSIVINLLSNSLKYSPNNSQIYIHLIREKKYIKIQVRDRGLGISEDDKAKIFDPFYRGKNVFNLSGTGLGLVIVKKYVELHQGSITLDSKLGEGTTITVSFPLS